MADLKGVAQTGALHEYLEEFDVLSHKVTLSKDYALSCFLSGFKGIELWEYLFDIEQRFPQINLVEKPRFCYLPKMAVWGIEL
ncbi:conserved hypothetical protein [Ricinus communis]|uniref:Retrotransposon gag domain-containing protein n=1 Tax=Ricinus communis TaxID=3988 RepID=B9SYU3_RICCO|nr:conserved hypothetical protein [Ricinus communis]